MPNPICPFADVVDLLEPEWRERAKIRPTASSAHTAGVNAHAKSIRGWFDRAEVKEDSHFFIDEDGTLHQWMPVDRRANAQAAGNGHVVSWETFDGGDPATPWTAAQVQMAGRLLAWLFQEWGIALDTATRWDGPGAAYHSCFPQWNPDRHGCPGPVRTRQLVHEVLPLARSIVNRPAPEPDLSEEDDMGCIPTWGPDDKARGWSYDLLVKGRRPVVVGHNFAPLNVDHPWTHQWVDEKAGTATATCDVALAADARFVGQRGDRIVVVCADGGWIDVGHKPPA